MNEKDADKILKRSQGSESYDSQMGHPRAHVDGNFNHANENLNNYNCIQKYSRTEKRKNKVCTAFESMDDQNKCAHAVLISDQAREKMKNLNDSGSDKQEIHVQTQDLALPRGLQEWPLIQFWYNGKRLVSKQNVQIESRCKKFVMIIGHFKDKFKDDLRYLADVMVITFYPFVDKKIRIRSNFVNSISHWGPRRSLAYQINSNNRRKKRKNHKKIPRTNRRKNK